MVELNEKTRLDLKFSNAWAILVSVVIAVTSVLAIYSQIIRRLDSIDIQLSYLVKQNDEYFERNHDLQNRVGVIEVWKAVASNKLGID